MPFGRSTASDYETLGTTPPILVARNGAPLPVQPGKDYFYVGIHAAQAAFRGSLFSRAKRLIVSSTVSAGRSGAFEDGLRSIQRSREVRPDTAVNLGIRSSLIGLVAARMTDVSIAIDFILDQEDRLAALETLINDDAFQATLSLAPGAGMAAKAVGSLAQNVIQTFVPVEERRPILEFSADFNLATDGLVEGYHVILGSQDPANPLPRPLPEVDVRDGELLIGDRPATQLSYVVLDIRRVAARTRELNEGAPWEAKLREAEDEAQLPSATTKASWEKCRGLVREAQTLLRADPNYLRQESDAIILSVLSTCKARLELDGQTRGATRRRHPRVSPSDLDSVALPRDLDVPSVIGSYAEQVMEARTQLADLPVAARP
jgi:hypothetical protein